MEKNLITVWPKAYLAGLAVLILSACSPRYDWRELRSTQSAWVALFPDKAQTQSRTMNLEGWPLDMTMTVTRVNDVSFVLGHATVSAQEASAEARPALSEVLRDAMLRNIRGEKKSEQTVQIARAGQDKAARPALAVEADGQVGDKPVHLTAWFASYVTDSKQEAIQIMVMGPPDVLRSPAGQQAVETFLTSLRLE